MGGAVHFGVQIGSGVGRVGVAAGFESIAEAMYLDTPVQVVPVEGHYEKRCNAVDAVRAGAGICSSTFNIDRLQDALPRSSADGTPFRTWVRRARCRFVREIEAAAHRRDAPAPVSMSPEPQRLETA